MFVEADPALKEQYFAQFEEQFFIFCDKELEKVNTFFAGLLFITFGKTYLSSPSFSQAVSCNLLFHDT